MTLLLLLCGITAIALPGVRPRPLIEADPRSFTRLAVTSVGVGITAVVGALVLSVSVGVMHVALGRPSTPVDHLAPEGDGGAAVAATLLALGVVRSVVFGVRTVKARRRSRAEDWLGHHQPLDGVDLVVLPTDAPVAYNVPGRRPQIIISQGLRRQVDADLLRFVVDHERAHLRSRHNGVVLLAAALDAVFWFAPGAGRAALAMRLGVERTADEQAAGTEAVRRSRLARGLAAHGARLRASGGDEIVLFRSRTLATRSKTSPWALGPAAAGVAAVLAGGVSLAVHATVDFGPYLAML